MKNELDKILESLVESKEYTGVLEVQHVELIRAVESLLDWIKSIEEGDERPKSVPYYNRLVKRAREAVGYEVCPVCSEEKVGVRKVYFAGEFGAEGIGTLMCSSCRREEGKEGRYYVDADVVE